MAKTGLKVYLDHHIKRENLLYRKAGSVAESLSSPLVPLLEGTDVPIVPMDTASWARHLKIPDLNRTKGRSLRKPDFQRATWAWSPEECVDLLESVLEERVVPSVIMWLSPDNFQYVLDGAHRISVLLAWIRNDWGDRLPADAFLDPLVQESNTAAALAVRKLLTQRNIGLFSEWEDAETTYNEIIDVGKKPKDELDFQTLKYAEKLRRWSAVEIGFPILWVQGDQDVAEQSFLKINKTGRQLSEWETKLVENRSSSFARVVMSVSQISGPEHCWTTDDPEVEKDPALKKQVVHVLELVHHLHNLVFEPPYKKPIDDLKQPILTTAAVNPENKPAYLAELLTIAHGRKGQKAEMEALIKKDSGAKTPTIIANGEELLRLAIDVVSEIYGPNPRSMGLLPLLYYYNKQGRHVRSLLFGMIYWINHGTATEVVNRKLLFSSHRGAFEAVLREYKEQIIKRIGRRIGSGPEVTIPTARYFDGLLRLLIERNDAIRSAEFKGEHQRLVNLLGKLDVDENLDVEEEESPSRTFRGGDRDAVAIRDFLDTAAKCEICGGLYSPNQFTQVDHVDKWGSGGKTKLSNARNTHPFCNNRRDDIEAVKEGTKHVLMPELENKQVKIEEQLSFIPAFEDYEDLRDRAEQMVFDAYRDGDIDFIEE